MRCRVCWQAFAGGYSGGAGGFRDGTGTNALVGYGRSKQGIVIRPTDKTLFIADSANSAVRKATTAGVMSTLVAGTLANPSDMIARSVAIDPVSTEVAVCNNRVIWRVSPDGATQTQLAGRRTGYANGNGANARFDDLQNLRHHPTTQTLYAVDLRRIRTIQPNGDTLTFAGSGSWGFANGGWLTALQHSLKAYHALILFFCFFSGNGEAASFAYMLGITWNPAGTVLYVTDSTRIRKITPVGDVTTWVGTGVQGDVNGLAATAQFQ